jgi:alkylation response protein AidB-like acyl-CoA dehydrogenase
MSHYKSNLRDLEFNLFEVFGVDKLMGTEAYPDIDVETARSVLAETARMARDDLGASYLSSDREPPVFDPATHSVVMPDAFKTSYKSFMDAEFWRMDLPSGLDGTPAPRALWWAFAEMVLGSNAPIWMYASGPSFATTLWREGTEEQKRWAKLFAGKRWGSTMVLTEPDAGSDVGAGRTKAIPQPDGSWHIEGVKRFITSAEHDLSDNIIHYVLARPVNTPGAGGPGTKGLSLFVVPKFHFDAETGELGERNGVFVTNVEHKMGLKASTTCELTFGEHGVPATGWLLGDVHEGIRQMFLVIEYARMMVGTKAIATLSTGYLNALDYARSRVQGADLTRQGDKMAPRVTITHHPDVRRSLMLQKSYAEGLRALVLYTASWQDSIKVAELSGDSAAAETAKRVNDFLLPIVKGAGSERAYELLGHESLQTFGGSGFLQDYPLEQYVRDAKIDTLYEGTTAIQSLDLIFRKIVKDRGVGLGTVAAEIQAFIEAGDEYTEPATADAGEPGDGRLKEERLALGQALSEASKMVAKLTTWIVASQTDPRELYRVGLTSRRVLLALGDLLVGWLLQRQASVALAALAGDGVSAADQAFYRGKVAAAKFFAHEVLPRLGADRRIVESTTLDLMDADEDVF